MSPNCRDMAGEKSISGVGSGVPKGLGVGEGLGAGVAARPSTAKNKRRKVTEILSMFLSTSSMVYQNTLLLATPRSEDGCHQRQRIADFAGLILHLTSGRGGTDPPSRRITFAA